MAIIIVLKVLILKAINYSVSHQDNKSTDIRNSIPTPTGYAFEHALHQYAVRSSLSYSTLSGMAPINATIKDPRNRGAEAGKDFRQIISATNAAQNGDKFNTAAVKSDERYSSQYYTITGRQIPVMNRMASLAILRMSASRAEKIASTIAPRDQEGEQRQQGDLCEAYKIRRTETSGRERGEWLLEGQRVAVTRAYTVPLR